MGSCFNFEKLKASTDEEAIRAGEALIDQAAYEHGHSGYTGSFAECRGVELVKANVPVEEVEAWLDEHAEKWGPMLIVKVGEEYFAGALCSS